MGEHIREMVCSQCVVGGCWIPAGHASPPWTSEEDNFLLLGARMKALPLAPRPSLPSLCGGVGGEHRE